MGRGEGRVGGGGGQRRGRGRQGSGVRRLLTPFIGGRSGWSGRRLRREEHEHGEQAAERGGDGEERGIRCGGVRVRVVRAMRRGGRRGVRVTRGHDDERGVKRRRGAGKERGEERVVLRRGAGRKERGEGVEGGEDTCFDRGEVELPHVLPERDELDVAPRLEAGVDIINVVEAIKVVGVSGVRPVRRRAQHADGPLAHPGADIDDIGIVCEECADGGAGRAKHKQAQRAECLAARRGAAQRRGERQRRDDQRVHVLFGQVGIGVRRVRRGRGGG
ncbi:hypothetical protein B0H10DRAFT_2099563 [Mycena sp. CBHHK59/15]|nr:hypothetical protein B0H10DRAFT_2099563 [Mycena sp. CBHHK59/15]